MGNNNPKGSPIRKTQSVPDTQVNHSSDLPLIFKSKTYLFPYHTKTVIKYSHNKMINSSRGFCPSCHFLTQGLLKGLFFVRIPLKHLAFSIEKRINILEINISLHFLSA